MDTPSKMVTILIFVNVKNLHQFIKSFFSFVPSRIKWLILNSNLKIYKQAKRDGRRGEEKKEKRETQKNKERNISTYLIFHLYIRVERTQYLWTPYFAPFCLFAQKSRRKKRMECFASRKVGIGT